MNRSRIVRGTLGLAAIPLLLLMAGWARERPERARAVDYPSDRVVKPLAGSVFSSGAADEAESIGSATSGMNTLRGTSADNIGTLGPDSEKLLAFHPDDADADAGDELALVQQAEKAGPKSTRLTGRDTEDDHPVLARGADGTIWLAYVEYTLGPPIVMEQVAERRFNSLVPRGNGDRIRLMRFDGKQFKPEVDFTEKGRDVFRPTITVDGSGVLIVAWAEKRDDAWDIFYRKYAPAKDSGGMGTLSKTVRLTTTKGSDFAVDSTTDAKGKVWLAWQSWNEDNFDIRVAKIEAGLSGEAEELANPVRNTKADEWSPSITADSRGAVYLAWDTYDKGNYDVRLKVFGNDPKMLNVADSPRFEARANVVCDASDRLWIAYEEGDEQWGKDFVAEGNAYRRVGLEKNPGFGLYVHRTIKVKCLSDGAWMQPAVDLKSAIAGTLDRNTSIARLAVDRAGGVWLSFRHHPKPTGAGEVWESYAVRYTGNKWSAPVELPDSSNLMDNRTALVPNGEGILAVYSGDQRTATRARDQTDLFAFQLQPDGPAAAPKLVASTPPELENLQPVHPNEEAAVTRLRNFRLKLGETELRPVRGEFHRHTEFTSHRDGDGLLEDSYRYALDAGKLDWMGNGDHDNGFGHEYMWWRIQKFCDLVHNPPHFTAALTYERSVVYPSGHRNVMFPKRGIRPLPRLGEGNNQTGRGNNRRQNGTLFGTPEEGSPDIKLLYDYLKHFNGICSSHTSATNMGTDWRDNDPQVEPVVEIYQGHRHNYEHFGAPRSPTEATQIGGYQPAGFVWNALEKGYRLGFQSSSDHISTHMSYGVVYVEEPSRQGVIDAFKKRHSYAATDNILLVVRSGDHLMGDAFETSMIPEIQVRVHGTADITKVHVVRNNKYVFTTQPNGPRVDFRYRDVDARPGETYYYYVRAEQKDGNLAWGSPMWITYRRDQRS